MTTPEYITDVPYERSFMDELSPTRMRMVAALNGFPSPPPEEFDYCELGAAHGDTTATLAAAYPRARFVGVDLNPDHVAVARDLASEGGLDNIRFVERDFEELGSEQLPDFDYVVAHGVLSWIGPEKRKAVLAFASAKLKPGGLLYVGYNALPGWAAVEPLRRILADRAAAVLGNSRERARQALDLAKRLAGAGAAYFTSNPSAMDMLATMDSAGLPYVAHEYLHAYWVPMYFADVAREMADNDLYFVGQMPLFLNYRDLAIPPTVAPLFEGITDRITFESLMGYALNQFFRRDVFIKRRPTYATAAAREYLESTPFGILGPGPIARKIVLPYYTLQFVGDVFDALLPALTQGATTVQELLERPEFPAFGAQTLCDAMMRLLIGGQASPMLRSTRAIQAPAAELCRVPLAFNRMVLQRRLSSGTPIALASPAAGTGMILSLLHGVALRLLTEVKPADRPAWIRELLERQPFRLKIGERASDDEQAPERALLDEVERFRVEQLPKLLELGIVQPE